MSELEGVPVFSAGDLHEQASRRLRAINAEWQASGCPLLTEGSMGQTIEHPLVKLIRETEIVCLRLGEAARKKHRGPAPRAVVQASIGKAPSASERKLRVAK